ncbi:MAG: HAMP domain-containing histidine kinase [Holosporaceae bacterium]|jgi:signal transduction histidine kinase|nr:HAMP domain-containing histidine kinase [Holosporaceae bacterium]
MLSSFKTVGNYCSKLTDAAIDRVDRHGARYATFGIFSLVNYLFPFYMWSDRSFETTALFIRVIAVILNFFLIIHESWPRSLQRYLPLFWYFTLMYSLPFFAFHMLCLDGISAIGLINVSFALILSLILMDFYAFLIVFSFGAAAAFAVAKITGANMDFNIGHDISFQIVYVMVLSGIISLVFSTNKEKIEREKIAALRDFGGIMAHEMRTPLSTISLLCKLIERELAKEKFDMQKVDSNTKKISREVNCILVYVDMALFKLNKQRALFDYTEQLSIKECILDAIAQYPFNNKEKELIVFEDTNDFLIKGNKNCVIHILFNLMRNAIYQIKSSGKGKVIISLSRRELYNILSFKDTASGVDSIMYGKLFSPMVTSKFSGTGLGLYFCKNAMESMGGMIRCNTVLGKFTEFVLMFPNLDELSIDGENMVISKN